MTTFMSDEKHGVDEKGGTALSFTVTSFVNSKVAPHWCDWEFANFSTTMVALREVMTFRNTLKNGRSYLTSTEPI